MPKEKSCGVILFKGDKYLLLRHADGGHWAPPKGGIAKGEGELQAAMREVAEETGLRGVHIIDEFREIDRYRFNRNGREISKEVIYYLGSVSRDRVILSPEHTDFRWAAIDEAVELATYDGTKKLLKAADRFLRDRKT
jgi:8-oxo-dGTP pyrophosphatase MutT (NUDIX family)